MRRLLAETFFVRHGHAKYNDDYPDLTEEGVKTIERSAELLRPLINRYQNLAIIASPSPRAQESAAIIAWVLGHKDKIRTEPNIQGVIAKDRQGAKAILLEYLANGGPRALAVAYGTDPRYEDGQVMEPRSEVRKRFLEYFSKLVRRLYISPNLPLCLIHVSHYETVCHIVESLFELDYEKDDPLGYGEIITFSIYDIEIENVVELEVTFRGRKINKKFFDWKSKEIR